MKSYKRDLAGTYKMTTLSCFGIFFVAIFSIFFFNGLGWAFSKNSLNYLVPLLSVLYILIIYVVLPILMSVVLVRVLFRFGGGAVLFSLIVMAIQFALMLAVAAVVTSFFINWEIIWQLFKGPTYVTFNFS